MKINDLDERHSGAEGQGSRASLLEQGLAHHEAGRTAQAQAVYRRILEVEPDHADALHLLGVAEHQTGDHAAAIGHISRAIALNPNVALYHNNLGSAYQSLNLLDEAGRCISKSLGLKPDYADAHYNLGVISDSRGESGKAEACFRQALLLRPGFTQAHFNLGILLRRAGRLAEAAGCFRQAVQTDPGNTTAQFLLAACAGMELDRAPDRYVTEVFDADADKFDQHLVGTLHYDTPQRLLGLCIGVLGGATGNKDILDLGCGTGLAGLAFAPFARQLVGVDLSVRMLDRARSRQLYQRLEQAEMLTMMQGEKTACYDVIVAADVFIYSGKLDGIFAEAKRLLRGGGLFVFSVESLDALPLTEPDTPGTRPFQLNANGRFAHSASYIRVLAASHGFRINAMPSAPTRLEAGKPVAAWMVVLESEGAA